MTFGEIETLLMNELRLYHHPIAVTFLKNEEQLTRFKYGVSYVTPIKPLTFCQWETAARMQGKTVLGTAETLACSNAKVSFGWREIDDNEIRSQCKYTRDREQAERFLRSKPRMAQGEVLAVGVGPLGQTPFEPDVVHLYCDSIQAYHLALDYMAVSDTHPLETQLMMSSAACGGSVWSYQQQKFNFSTPCSGSYNAGKTERGEVYVFIPGSRIAELAQRLKERVEKNGTGTLTRPGDYFPGGDICKNCPLIGFKSPACADCEGAGN